METLNFDYPASQPVPRRAHVGVVGSGDLEVLLEPSPDERAHVRVRTSADGFGEVWEAVLDRFFARDQSYRTISSELDLPAGTIASRIARCLRKLRVELEGRSEPPQGSRE